MIESPSASMLSGPLCTVTAALGLDTPSPPGSGATLDTVYVCQPATGGVSTMGPLTRATNVPLRTTLYDCASGAGVQEIRIAAGLAGSTAAVTLCGGHSGGVMIVTGFVLSSSGSGFLND